MNNTELRLYTCAHCETSGFMRFPAIWPGWAVRADLLQAWCPAHTEPRFR